MWRLANDIGDQRSKESAFSALIVIKGGIFHARGMEIPSEISAISRVASTFWRRVRQADLFQWYVVESP